MGKQCSSFSLFTLQWDRYRHGKQRTVIISSNISTPLRPAFHGRAASLDKPMVFLLLWVPWHRMSSSMKPNFLLWDWSLTGLLTSAQTGRNLPVVHDTVWWVGSVLGFVLRQQLMKLPKLVSNSCYSCLGRAVITGARHHIWLWLSVFFLLSVFMS